MNAEDRAVAQPVISRLVDILTVTFIDMGFDDLYISTDDQSLTVHRDVALEYNQLMLIRDTIMGYFYARSSPRFRMFPSIQCEVGLPSYFNVELELVEGGAS